MDVAEKQLLSSRVVTESELLAWKEEAAREVQAAVAQAQQEPTPDPFIDDWTVYASKEIATIS